MALWAVVMRWVAGLSSEIGKNGHALFEQAEEGQFDAGSFHMVEELRSIVGRMLELVDPKCQRMSQALGAESDIRRAMTRLTFGLRRIDGIEGTGDVANAGSSSEKAPGRRLRGALD